MCWLKFPIALHSFFQLILHIFLKAVKLLQNYNQENIYCLHSLPPLDGACAPWMCATYPNLRQMSDFDP